MAAQLKIISSMATQHVLAELARQFEQISPTRVAVETVGGVDAARRVQAGEAGIDVVVLAAHVIDQLIEGGHVVAGSRTDIVTSGVSVAVRRGAARPDIGSADAVRAAVLAARTVGYSTGPSGVQLVKQFERWGIAKELEPRLVQAPPGVPVGSLVASGKVELGFQQLSELMHVDGIDVVGPLPAEIEIITTFSAGLSTASTQADAARAFLAHLVAPAAVPAKLRNGMAPA